MSIAPPLACSLGELRESGYVFRSLRDEIQANLRRRLREGTPLFPDIRGYRDSVVPAVENALLSGHDMIFLGERGILTWFRLVIRSRSIIRAFFPSGKDSTEKLNLVM